MKVRFTRTAQRDLAEIFAYISQDSPTIASRFVARLVERAREIGDHPFAGRATDEAPRLRYLIFYTVIADEVQVTHIRHTSRFRPGNGDDNFIPLWPVPISGITSSHSYG